MIQDFSVQCTWEGDNTVLMLQAGRYLINSYREWQNGSRLPEGINYLNKLPGILIEKCKGNPMDPDEISNGFDVIRANLVKKAYEDFESVLKQGKSKDEAYESCAISRSEAARFHCYGLIYQDFLIAAREIDEGHRKILLDLCLLYGLHTIKTNSGMFLLYEYYKPQHIKMIDEHILDLFARIRPQAVPLVDAFNLPDFVINTPLGSFNGDIYKDFFGKIKTRNPPMEHPYKNKIIQILNRSSQVNDNGPSL